MVNKHLIIQLLVSLFICAGQFVNAQSLSTELEALADIVVDIDGGGDYTSVQKGINAIPDNSMDTTILFVKNGTYQEKVILGHTKKNVILIGESADSTIITWDDWGDKMLPGGHTFSTYTFRADPHGFQAYNIQFNNPTTKGQGVAYHSNGDKQLLYHCRITGNQDTYFDNFRTRRYIKDCYIEGTVDFIFGFGVTLFDSCQIHDLSSGYITASSTPQYYEFGHVFKDCRITTGEKVASASLGRPWFAYANTSFMQCWMSDGIKSAGWSKWDGRESTCIYNEYDCYGPGADTTYRVAFGNQLTDIEAQSYTMANILSADNFPSEMGEVVDSVELWSMRNRFEASGYSDRADTILYAGRENWPEYPDDDWTPVINQQIASIIDKYTVSFNDSANYNANVAEIKVQNETVQLDTGKTEYVLELEEGVTEAPEITVIPEDINANVEVVYPETVPGVTTVKVTSYDRSHFKSYTFYNSVNGSYDNALLDSIILNRTLIPGFDPEVFEYDFVLPEGTSKYFPVKIYRHVEDASYKLVKVKSLPGEMTVTVTSYSGAVTNVYKINVTVSTGINDAYQALDMKFRYVDGSLVCCLDIKENETIELDILDLNGQTVAVKEIKALAGEQELVIPISLAGGIYLYRASVGDETVEGKLLVK